ncbi:hypothetical protein PUN28_015445 [Cardiocondyla obscurior]|uniref:Uncharacterized protein n=1 Tax=Cardiocondyla obscurior TaxID=286306 RepID=A0AAW2EWF5_9HYME
MAFVDLSNCVCPFVETFGCIPNLLANACR